MESKCNDGRKIKRWRSGEGNVFHFGIIDTPWEGNVVAIIYPCDNSYRQVVAYHDIDHLDRLEAWAIGDDIENARALANDLLDALNTDTV